jgi:hypothetical protein
VLKNVIGDLDRGKYSMKNQRLFDNKVKPQKSSKVEISKPLTIKLSEITSASKTPQEMHNNSIVNHGSALAEETPMATTDR